MNGRLIIWVFSIKPALSDLIIIVDLTTDLRDVHCRLVIAATNLTIAI